MRWGIDLGGTKIEGIVLDDELKVLARRRIPTLAHRGMDHIVAQICSLTNTLAEEVGQAPTRIGIGTPGSVDPTTGLVKGSNTQQINHQPFPAALERALQIPLTIANDANCFALAETTLGAVAERCSDARVVFGVILGTGVGGGIIIDGRAHLGRHGIAGEWGHTFLDTSGGACYCGSVGCVECILSGPALQRFYREQSGSELPLVEIAARARQGADEHAERTMDRLVHFFGLALSQVVNILDPDAIVLGGGLSNLELLYEAGARAVKAHVFNPTFHTPILRPNLGDSAGVFGAALL